VLGIGGCTTDPWSAHVSSCQLGNASPALRYRHSSACFEKAVIQSRVQRQYPHEVRLYCIPSSVRTRTKSHCNAKMWRSSSSVLKHRWSRFHNFQYRLSDAWCTISRSRPCSNIGFDEATQSSHGSDDSSFLVPRSCVRFMQGPSEWRHISVHAPSRREALLLIQPFLFARTDTMQKQSESSSENALRKRYLESSRIRSIRCSCQA
jgi:hypothetical protein